MRDHITTAAGSVITGRRLGNFRKFNKRGAVTVIRDRDQLKPLQNPFFIYLSL